MAIDPDGAVPWGLHIDNRCQVSRFYRRYVEAMASRAPRMRVLPETKVDPAPLCLEVGLAMVLRPVLFAAELPPVPVAIGVMPGVVVMFWKRTWGELLGVAEVEVV